MKRHIRQTFSAIILAGGKGKRMHADKALLKIGDITLVEYLIERLRTIANEIIVSVRDKHQWWHDLYPILQKYKNCKIKYAVDEKTDRGPLLGIMSGLKESDNNYNFVIACDVPTISIDFIEKMSLQIVSCDAVIAVNKQGCVVPVYGFYSKKTIDQIHIFSKGKKNILPLSF